MTLTRGNDLDGSGSTGGAMLPEPFVVVEVKIAVAPGIGHIRRVVGHPGEPPVVMCC